MAVSFRLAGKFAIISRGTAVARALRLRFVPLVVQVETCVVVFSSSASQPNIGVQVALVEVDVEVVPGDTIVI